MSGALLVRPLVRMGAPVLALALAVAPAACRKTEPVAVADATPPSPLPSGEGYVAPGVVSIGGGPDFLSQKPDRPPGLPEPEPTLSAWPTDPLPPPESAPGVPAPTGPAAAAAPPPDPFAGAIASVRASAVGCFQGQPPGEYAATLSVVVSPAGRATRVEVSGAPNPAIGKCLEQAGTGGSYPSSPDGRKLSIDVRVKG